MGYILGFWWGSAERPGKEVLCFQRSLGYFHHFEGAGCGRWVMSSDSFGICRVSVRFMMGFWGHVPGVKVFVFNYFWVIPGIWGISGIVRAPARRLSALGRR